MTATEMHAHACIYIHISRGSRPHKLYIHIGRGSRPHKPYMHARATNKCVCMRGVSVIDKMYINTTTKPRNGISDKKKNERRKRLKSAALQGHINLSYSPPFEDTIRGRCNRRAADAFITAKQGIEISQISHS